MSRPAVLVPQARREAAAAVAWLADENPAAARNLRNAFVDAATLLGQRPLAGRGNKDLVGERYRIWSLVRFPYVLVYDPDARPPRIVRIVHTSRDLPDVLSELLEASSEGEGRSSR